MRELLYKYCPINAYTYTNLILGQIHFSRVQDLNDQFEGLTHLTNPDFKSSDKAFKKFFSQYFDHGRLYDPFLTRQQLYLEAINTDLTKNHLVCSFSQTSEEPVLWAHYGESQKGICLVYDKAILLESLAMDYSYADIKLFDVQYGQRPHTTITETEETIHYHSDIHLLAAKSKTWRYEKETRLIINSSKIEGNNLIAARCALVGCIFGFNAELQHIKSIQNILDSEQNYQYTYLAQVSVDPKTGKLTCPLLPTYQYNTHYVDLWPGIHSELDFD